MSLQRKIERIENQVSGSLPVPETTEHKWAYVLARARFAEKHDPAERRAIIYLNSIRTEPEPEESLVFPDTPNIHFEPDPEQRAAKVQKYASELVHKYGSYEQYQAAMQENNFVLRYFRGLQETDQRQRALGEPVY